ncbi:hypothetical protein PHMEG_0008833 [Phytophthora megakarya]|uniref:Uncharacterized protein n=1 Tax=Phytophthora megakarya TaxID=4795 RepID=A0A225WIH6_9STRA|nr:hypothetical protein PHMEG_0008833 [Phytophthora megakarya]
MKRAGRNHRVLLMKKGSDESQLVPECCGPYQRTFICTPGGTSGSRTVMGAVHTSTAGELQMKNGCIWHNHPTSAAVSRGVADPVVGARVEGMLANIIQSDADNMVRGHASSVSTVDDNKTTIREVAAFFAADPENLSPVADTDAEETGVIAVVTAHMRRIYARFSELLLVGCSPKPNRCTQLLDPYVHGHERIKQGTVV